MPSQQAIPYTLQLCLQSIPQAQNLDISRVNFEDLDDEWDEAELLFGKVIRIGALHRSIHKAMQA